MSKTSRTERKRPANGSPDVATRDLLLNAAGELMTERRSTDVSLSDIASKSGLNSALVKYYFGSKSGLMLALLRKVMGPGMEQLRHLPDMDLTPQQKLRVHISGIVKTYFRHPFINRLMHQLLAEDAATFGPILAEEFSRPVAEAQRKILQEGTEAGIFDPVDPLLFYFHINGACDQLFFGQYQLEHIFGVSELSEELRRNFVDHLYRVVTEGILVGSKVQHTQAG